MPGTNEDSPGSPASPKNRMKLLCSYGGKILPRPSDGILKYVGGETRVVSVPRSITFPELMEKISGMFNNTDIVMKYQVMPEDLDVLVSVRSDEDLHHMLEEYDRYESLPRSPSSSPRFRIFLFPSITLPATPRSPSYVDTINASSSIAIPAPNNRPTFTISYSSAGTSPTSTIDYLAGGGRPTGLGMHRVRSTPNLSGSLSQLANNTTCVGSTSASHHRNKMTGGSHRHEGCGCSCSISGQHSQRRNYFSPYGGPPTGGYGCHPGHMEDSYRARSGHSSFQFSGQPPVAPRRNIWD